MAMKDSDPKDGKAGGRRRTYRFSPWKKALLVLAALLVVGGGVLAFVEPAPEKDAGTSPGPVSGPAGGTSADPGLVKGFGGSGTGTSPGIRVEIDPGLQPAEASDGTWSRALLQGGISFFVAFCAAFALRTFLRIAAVFLAIGALSLFLLSYVNWVDVDWEEMDRQFQNLVPMLEAQFWSFKAFLTGSLPSAAMAGLGLVTGFKKK